MTPNAVASRHVHSPDLRFGPCIEVLIKPAEHRLIADIAGKIRSAQPDLRPAAPSMDEPTPGLHGGSRLVIEDHREIPLCRDLGSSLEERALFMAGDGDVVLASEPRCAEFEDYCRNLLGLGRVVVKRLAGPAHMPLPTRCSADAASMSDLLELARTTGDLDLVPYIGTASVWGLARVLAAAGVRINVAAPPAALTSRVNNKLWFVEMVRSLVGPEAAPATWEAASVAELADHLEELARCHEGLVVKVAESAGGRGIVRLDGATIRSRGAAAVVRRLARRLGNDGWTGRYPLQVGVWEHPILASPSVQVWIPLAGDGDPTVQGVYEQCLDGGYRFAGAFTTTLPERWNLTLATEAVRLGMLLQALGYFGPCSFDGILVGSRLADATLRWVECNGRWTSTSLAQLTAWRLTGNTDLPLVTIQHHGAVPARSFDSMVRLLGGDAFHKRDDGSGAVIMAPRRMLDGTGLCLLVVGPNVTFVGELARDLSERFSDRTHR
ncbi:MAG TPA: hypothetical protein VLT15_02055 [Acidimicrobiia bacterium]|nr:hypothetical protein [Acidimicrobiia bacterium]